MKTAEKNVTTPARNHEKWSSTNFTANSKNVGRIVFADPLSESGNVGIELNDESTQREREENTGGAGFVVLASLASAPRY